MLTGNKRNHRFCTGASSNCEFNRFVSLRDLHCSIHEVKSAIPENGFLDKLRKFWLILFCFSAIALPAGADAGEELSNPNLISIAELQSRVFRQGRVIQSFRIEGVVCAVIQGRKMITLQDSSATVLFELPYIDD